MKPLILSIVLALIIASARGQEYKLYSPNEKIQVAISNSKVLTWSVTINKQPVITDATLSMSMQNGDTWGEGTKITSAKPETKIEKISAFNYKKEEITDHYNQLTLNCRGNFSIVFRAYNEGIAYRFVSNKKDSLIIKNENASFNFSADHYAYVPYVNDAHENDVFQCSFENNYLHLKLSEIKKDTLSFAPVLIELPNNIKAAITEADLEDYPGMFLQAGKNSPSLHGVFAPRPISEKQGGHNNLQSFVTSRADYIARTSGKRSFPWRVVIISENDKDLLNNDMVYKLASPSRVQDVTWIKPGKVAWDWWNDWNISGVDFRAGINTNTYKYYVDFASANKIENILLDEGWASSTNIMQVVPEINLQEIIDYAKSKGVGVWLWGGWLPLEQQLDHALSTYSKMGVKGFKLDFMDRDDQNMVQFMYRFASKAAEYKLMVDFHGTYKPTGLQRTYPNVINFEGVRGLENVKWSNTDFPQYDCSIPFIRMLAGPMDYTPGAMRNANKSNFRAMNSIPMSQGTRCHQLALYVIFESPFEMLCDNPTIYMKEKESLDFMATIPTTFSETVALDGKVSEYAVIARRKSDTWYVGAITNWDAREINVDLSFLGEGNFEAQIFQDGVNADREGTDYKKVIKQISPDTKLPIKLSPGGGWVARIVKK